MSVTMRWHAHFDELTTTGGMVTAAEPLAAEAGAEMLRRGGNAVDAAVATAFVLGVVEPQMSGLGGGTLMTIRMDDRVTVYDGAIRAPLATTTDRFPLVAQDKAADWAVSFYDWPPVAEAANILGPRAVGVPGTVATLLQAHERFGRLPRADVMAPAIAIAEDGFEINWFLAAMIASNARGLGRDPGCAETFLRGGLPMRGPEVRRAHRLVQPKLARTLELIASEGPAVFYEGEVGAALVRCVSGGGGLLADADLRAYEPAVVDDAPSFAYRGLELCGPPATGFPSVLQMLALVEAGEARDLPESLRWGYASKIAMVDRFLYMTADPDDGTPWDVLVSAEYARERLDAEIAKREPPVIGPAEASTGASSGFTSHHSVVDADGNAVSVTQTVLNTFGARVLDPVTGVLFNDGMAYFDPRPGSRNGIRPGVPAFSAMTPVIAARDGAVFASYGASGGRRIIPGVAQMTHAIAGGAAMQDAIEAPRIYAESDIVLLDARWPDGAAEPLAAAGFTVETTDEQPTTVHFARPNGILVDRAGVRHSGVDPKKPGGAATAENTTRGNA